MKLARFRLASPVEIKHWRVETMTRNSVSDVMSVKDFASCPINSVGVGVAVEMLLELGA